MGVGTAPRADDELILQVAATYTVSGTNEFLSVDRHEKIVTGGFNR